MHTYVRSNSTLVRLAARALVIALLTLVGCERPSGASGAPPESAPGQDTLAQQGDWGDAPDEQPTGYLGGGAFMGHFPSARRSLNCWAELEPDGAHIEGAPTVILGDAVSSETDLRDPLDADGTFNERDDDHDEDALVAVGPFAGGRLQLGLRVRNLDAAPVRAYLNTLVDHDQSGTWEDLPDAAPEWVVVNREVELEGSQRADLTVRFPEGIDLPLEAWTTAWTHARAQASAVAECGALLKAASRSASSAQSEATAVAITSG